jgi:hypothetical protein
MLWITKENVDQAVAWKADDKAIELVYQMFEGLKQE